MKISLISQRRKKAVVIKKGKARVAQTYAVQIAKAAAHVRERRLHYTVNFAKRGEVNHDPKNGILAG